MSNFNPSSVVGKHISECPHVIYGRVVTEELNKVNKKIKEIWSDNNLSPEQKLSEITWVVGCLQQPIVRLIEDRENLQWEFPDNQKS